MMKIVGVRVSSAEVEVFWVFLMETNQMVSGNLRY